MTAVGFLGLLWAIRFYGGIPDEGVDAANATSLNPNESFSNVTLYVNATNLTFAPALEPVDPVAAALADQQAKSGAPAVWTAMVTALSTSLVCMVVFSIVRPRLPQAYIARKMFWDTENQGLREEQFTLPPGFFGWLPALLAVSEESLLDLVGFDGYIFLRYLNRTSEPEVFSRVPWIL
eukprot:SAG11_NODE_4986_length_1703_cov_1.437656_2_plen_179_part_00